jgi:hypothetical protein
MAKKYYCSGCNSLKCTCICAEEQIKRLQSENEYWSTLFNDERMISNKLKQENEKLKEILPDCVLKELGLW